MMVVGLLVQANPVRARIPFTLSLVYLRLGNKQQARTPFERFVALAPSRFSSQVTEVRQQLATLQ
jgi:hypothetical protein